MPLLVAFLGFAVAGILIGATRETRTETAVATAMRDCEAKALPETDGLSDAYGVVQFRYHQGDVTRLLTLCDTNPRLALRIFREALASGSPSAKMVALHSAFFLAANGQLEADEFQRIVSHMNPEQEKDGDVCKVAQRAVSDLTVIEDSAAHSSRYEKLPEGLSPPVKDAGPHKVQTKEDKLASSGKAVLLVRWSSTEVAYKWWSAMAGKGCWDKGLQRYVIPAAE
ncbi:MAG: hypothetical protein NTW87_27335 [Planctomycetota bacterium]|nr:hypothetical protein [Planctomycetota bacterium]